MKFTVLLDGQMSEEIEADYFSFGKDGGREWVVLVRTNPDGDDDEVARYQVDHVISVRKVKEG